jgi:exopolysaccharide biosynthesis polyprenyl glycosylphosphotransferase
MIAPRTKGRIYFQSLIDAMVTLSLFWVCLLIFVVLRPADPLFYLELLDRYLVYSLLAFGIILLHGARTIYSQPRWWTPALKESHHLSLNQVVHVAVGISLFLVATKDKGISRIFLFSWLPVLYGVLLAANRFLPEKIAQTLSKETRDRAIFLGGPDSLQALAGWREYQATLGTEFIEYKAEFSISDLSHLEQLIRRQNATQLIVTEIPELKYNLHYIIDVCERLGVRLLVFSNFENLFRHKVTFIEDAGLQFIALRDEPLESPHNQAIKRVLDVILALPIVVIVLPVITGFVWLAQRLQSPGPVFFRQQRAGLKGRNFTILKFRTMHAHDTPQARQVTEGDSRLYPIGSWLRRTSLDELPQFLNVLRGEMSLVGPRPHLIEHNEQFARVMRNYYIRTAVKPGITGLAQVRGFRGETRTEQDVIRRVESDISYLETWTLSLDLVILLRTLWQIIRPPKTAR